MQGDNEPLLGAIPLEDMEVLIHPLKQELVVNPEHPYYAQMKLVNWLIRGEISMFTELSNGITN